jgi:hypothetical protein
LRDFNHIFLGIFSFCSLNCPASSTDSIQVNVIHYKDSHDGEHVLMAGSADLIQLFVSPSDTGAPSPCGSENAPPGLAALNRWNQWNDGIENFSGVAKSLAHARKVLSPGGILYVHCQPTQSAVIRSIGELIFESAGVALDGGSLLCFIPRGLIAAHEGQEQLQLTACGQY